VAAALAGSNATPEVIAQLEHELGLDRPLTVQYVEWLGHIVRGENIQLVDGGAQKRAFTYVDDGIGALMKIIENKNGVADSQIYNIGNPKNNFSVRELAEMMLKMAADYPEYAEGAQTTRIIETSSGQFYGKGYQDVQNRLPRIEATMTELGWKPQVDMETALRRIFESYRQKVLEARSLIDSAT
jgi:nucleoside-diphosphate-sugar epimerase